MLIGLAAMCLGGYVAINSLWRGQTPSILADIGLRLVSTGYVVVIFSGMADILELALIPARCTAFWCLAGARNGDRTGARSHRFRDDVSLWTVRKK